MGNLQSINRYLTNDKTQEYLSSVLGKNLNSFVTSVISLVSSNTKLAECTPSSVMYAALKAAALKLPLDSNLGQAYAIPYKRNFRNPDGKWESLMEAQFQVGYKGFIQLAIRTKQFSRINVTDVREGELKKIDRLSGDYEFEWKDDDERINLPIVGFVAYFKLNNGFSKQWYMTSKQLEAHGEKYSKTYSRDDSRWKKEFEEMSAKTVIKQLLSKYAPLSIEDMGDIREAITVDQAVVTQDGVIYVDNDNVDEDKLDILNIESAQVVEKKTLTPEKFEECLTKYMSGDSKIFEEVEKYNYELTDEQQKRIAEANVASPQ